jgi:hypothetical protein
MSILASHKLVRLVKDNVEQFERIGELEVARKENYIAVAKVDRLISELDHIYDKAPWSDPRHPEDQRSMIELSKLRQDIELSLRDSEQLIRECYLQIELNKIEIEQLEKEEL